MGVLILKGNRRSPLVLNLRIPFATPLIFTNIWLFIELSKDSEHLGTWSILPLGIC